MDKVNGKISRPVRIISSNSFSIENTKKYQKPGEGGFMYLANVPQSLDFEEIEKVMSDIS